MANWLSGLACPNETIRMSSYNGHSLDAPLMWHNLSRFGGPSFNDISRRIVFSDSLKSFRNYFPNNASFAFRSIIEIYVPENVGRTSFKSLDIANNQRDLVEDYVNGQMDPNIFLRFSETSYS